MLSLQRQKVFHSRYTKTRKCWIWNGVHNSKGYGYFYTGTEMIGAHRVAYILARGSIPKGLMVLHSCDNPACVNPKHLRVGTNTDNLREAAAKGRMKGGPGFVGGENHPKSVLSSKDIYAIRRFRKQGATRKYLSDKFCVSEHRISRIINNHVRKDG